MAMGENDEMLCFEIRCDRQLHGTHLVLVASGDRADYSQHTWTSQSLHSPRASDQPIAE